MTGTASTSKGAGHPAPQVAGVRRQPGEPDAAAFGASLGGQIRRYWMALRPPFFQASVSPVLVGTAWGAAHAGTADIVSAVLAGLCMVLGHGAGNLLNDIHDDMSGNDAANNERIYPFSGGSRFIQNQIMSRRTMWIYALTLLVLTAVPGVILLFRHGWGIAGFGAVLFALLSLHHLPPVRLSYRGFAEIDIALSFGVVPMLMAIWLQTGNLSWPDLLAAVPVAMWVANILLINEIPDRAADAHTDKKTFVVLFGVAASRRLHIAGNAAALAACVALVGLGALSAWGLIGIAGVFALGLHSASHIDTGDRARMTAAIKMTLMVHASGTLWLAGWILLS